jgi:hypothetical protein
MATLNKVITQQEINSRDVDHNLAMLLGVASEQGKSIRAVKNDMDLRFDVVDQQILEVKRYIEEVRREVSEVKQSMEASLIKCCRCSLRW